MQECRRDALMLQILSTTSPTTPCCVITPQKSSNQWSMMCTGTIQPREPYRQALLLACCLSAHHVCDNQL